MGRTRPRRPLAPGQAPRPRAGTRLLLRAGDSLPDPHRRQAAPDQVLRGHHRARGTGAADRGWPEAGPVPADPGDDGTGRALRGHASRDHAARAGGHGDRRGQAVGYKLQVNRKTREGESHPDRDAQFQYIATQVSSFERRGQPVVSVDTKKKELLGDFKNAGREWQHEGTPGEVRCKDFKDKELGKVAPHGVYEERTEEGWVSVGIDHDTAEFATETLRRWWSHMGTRVYPGRTACW